MFKKMTVFFIFLMLILLNFNYLAYSCDLHKNETNIYDKTDFNSYNKIYLVKIDNFYFYYITRQIEESKDNKIRIYDMIEIKNQINSANRKKNNFGRYY